MITGTTGQPTIIDEASLADIVTFVWQTLVDEDIERAESAGPEAIGAAMSASISIGGVWTATIVVVLGVELAHRYSAQLLGMDAGELTSEDVRDAVGELANMVGGNVKGMLDDGGSSTLSLPIVTESEPTVTGGELTVSAGFWAGGLPMTWEMYERP